MLTMLYFLPMILFLGIVTSYEDIKENKIKNKWIVLGIFYAIAINAVLFFSNKINAEYSLLLALNGLICLALGAALWYLNFWSAGDTKLFFVYSLLLPLNFYVNGFVKYAPSITLLLNLFILASFYMIFLLFFKLKKKHVIFFFRKEFSFKEILTSLLFIFGFIWIVNLAVSSVGIRDLLFVFLVYLVAFLLIERFFKKYFLVLGILLALLRLFFDKNVFSMSTLIGLLGPFIFWLIFIKLLLYVSGRVFTRKVKIKDLKEGMLLAEKITVKSSRKKSLTIPSSIGISLKDLKKLKAAKKNRGSVATKQTIAFAPFLSISMILTIAVKGSIVAYLLSFL